MGGINTTRRVDLRILGAQNEGELIAVQMALGRALKDLWRHESLHGSKEKSEGWCQEL